MKRVRRDPAKFDAIELYTAVGRDRGYRLNVEGDMENFLDTVKGSLQASQTNPLLLHGKRAEALFAYVAGALGHCRLIKKEDSGDIFTAAGNVIAPDYRIVLNDGSKLLVEVKNFFIKSFSKEFTLPVKTMAGLEHYAELNGLPLKIAVYFSNANAWVLLSKSAFKKSGKHFAISFVQAMAVNEMATLGDRSIATLPRLAIQFWTTPELAMEPDENSEVVFTIKAIKFECGDTEIIGDEARDIAFYLMRYGRWSCGEQTPLFDGNKVIALQFVFEPDEVHADQGFETIGGLSQMVSSAYRELTVDDTGVMALDIRHDPEVFTLRIPQGFKNETLPLWQFILQPNPKFGKADAEKSIDL
ncbi:hypothetical protein FHS25_006268 [Rhizobium laguerreae]|uniref:Restriction endonuclease n=1 Tax=Rhizobium laguerreae TaxID=1076926 RepID=A0ABR6GHI0_9HYPH|nr:hypothetical protein [Rhizobium laguerreae]MBB3165756.1 hypothetical protein [Rhizobium laguerreae]